MATLSQSRPTAGHRAQQLQQQTSRPRALQQCQSVLLLLRHGLDHEVPVAFIAWRRMPSTANAGTITKSQHFHFDGGTRPPTTSTKMSAGRAPVGRRWCWCLCCYFNWPGPVNLHGRPSYAPAAHALRGPQDPFKDAPEAPVRCRAPPRGVGSPLLNWPGPVNLHQHQRRPTGARPAEIFVLLVGGLVPPSK